MSNPGVRFSVILGLLLISFPGSTPSEPLDCGDSRWCRQFCPYIHNIFKRYTGGSGELKDFGIEFRCHDGRVSDQEGWKAREDKTVCEDWCKLIHGYYEGERRERGKFLRCWKRGATRANFCKGDRECEDWCNNIHELREYQTFFEKRCIRFEKPPRRCDDYYLYSIACPTLHLPFPLDPKVNTCFYYGMKN